MRKGSRPFNQDDPGTARQSLTKKKIRHRNSKSGMSKKAVFAEVLGIFHLFWKDPRTILKNLARDILCIVAANKYQLDLQETLWGSAAISQCQQLFVPFLFAVELSPGGKPQDGGFSALRSMNSAFLIETDVYKDFFHNQRSDLVFEVTKSMFWKRRFQVWEHHRTITWI